MPHAGQAKFAAQCGGAAGRELLEHLAVPPGHGGAEPFQISRPPAFANSWWKRIKVTAGPGRADPGHEPGSEIGHEGVEAFLMLGAAEVVRWV